MKKKRVFSKGTVWFLFVVYLAFLLYFLFWSEYFGRTERIEGFQYNLEPFREIGRYVHLRSSMPKLFVTNIIGNIAAFVPFGVLLPVLLPVRMKRLWVTFFLSYLLSLSVETAQAISHVGIFDLDDIILNTLGGVGGYIIYRVLRRLRVY